MYKVFIADDEMWVIIGLKKLIEKLDLPFQVIGEANNGVVALEEIQAQKPDILFTDIRMPGYNGLELIERLRKNGSDMKVILISGYAEFEYAQSALRMGAFDYLIKPIEQERLQDVLERIMSESDEPVIPEETVNLSVIGQVVEEIKNNYTSNITLTGLSEKYGISTSHLSALIKEHAKLPFSDYLATKRIQKAKELLEDERLSIDNIAEQVGYNDYFYFTKVFKKYTGISPSKYRKKLLSQ